MRILILAKKRLKKISKLSKIVEMIWVNRDIYREISIIMNTRVKFSNKSHLRSKLEIIS